MLMLLKIDFVTQDTIRPPKSVVVPRVTRARAISAYATHVKSQRRVVVRKISFFIMLALGASLLAGCRHENSVTGPTTGTGVLSGQIVAVGDLAGSSVAGISVTCSGQVVETDASGRFTFVGLSANSERFAFSAGDRQLSFSRSDGINASANVSSDASSVVVHLQKTQATVIVTGQSKREIEGLITAVSSTSITVNDASTGGPVTSAITSS